MLVIVSSRKERSNVMDDVILMDDVIRTSSLRWIFLLATTPSPYWEPGRCSPV